MAKNPEKIGKYKIVERLGRGGMGLVYKGIHPTLERPVVLKKLNVKTSEKARERFRREADIMMDLRHENIVSVYDHFKDGASYYIAMEYVDGISLGELIRRSGSLDKNVAVYIILCCARALAYIHGRSIVHRDIKPSNIFISRSGQVKLGDFGVAADRESPDEDITDSGATLGTPTYMAPEQLNDSRNVDERADIYALGVTFYESLAGIPLYPSPHPGDIREYVKDEKQLPGRSSLYSGSGLISAVLRKCLRTSPGRRYRNLTPMVKSLEKELGREGESKASAALAEILIPLLANDLGQAVYPSREKSALNEETSRESYESDSVRGDSFLNRFKNNLSGRINRFSEPLKKYKWGVIAFVLILFLLGVWIGGGGYYELLKPGRFGAVRIKLHHGDFQPETSFLNKTIRIFHYGDNEAQPVDLSFSFRKNRESFYLSNKKYLPAGYYRIEIDLEYRKLTQSFFVHPREIQKEKEISWLTVEDSLGEPPTLPLALGIQIADALSGESLKESAVSEVMDASDEWIDPRNAEKNFFESGRQYIFRFSAPGYQPLVLPVESGPYQTRLIVRARLLPESAVLYLETEPFESELFINGSREYMSAGESKNFVTAESDSFKVYRLDLYPGSHHFRMVLGEDEFSWNWTLEKGTHAQYKLIRDTRTGDYSLHRL